MFLRRLFQTATDAKHRRISVVHRSQMFLEKQSDLCIQQIIEARLTAQSA